MSADDHILNRIGEPDLTRLACYLLEAATLPSGEIEAQQFGLGQPSLASVGAVSEPQGRLALTTRARPLIAMCESAIRPNGRLVSPSGARPTDWTSWSGAQVLLGLLRRPHLVNAASIGSLCDALIRDFFDVDGGTWSFRGEPGDQLHPVFDLYPTLALLNTRSVLGQDGVTEAALAATYKAALEGLLVPQSIDRALLMLFLVVLVQPASVDLPAVRGARDRAEATLLAKIERNEYPENVVIRQSAQPLWYVAIDRQFSYLVTRRIWPLAHPINVWSTIALDGGFDQVYDGWRAHEAGPGESIYSWSSALGLLATALLLTDIRSGSEDRQRFLSRIEEVQLTKHKYD